MKYFTTEELCASFLLDGKMIRITPGKHTFDGGLEVILEHSKTADNADYLKIHLKNTGDADTARIQNVKTLALDVTTAEVPLYHSLDGDDCGAVSFMPRNFEVTCDYHEEPCGGRSSDLTGFPYFDLTWGTDSAVCDRLDRAMGQGYPEDGLRLPCTDRSGSLRLLSEARRERFRRIGSDRDRHGCNCGTAEFPTHPT